MRCTSSSPIPTRARDLNRWLPLVKWLLAIPHYIVLFVPLPRRLLRGDRGLVRDPVHGRYPRGIFDYVEGVMRWHNRVVAYAFILVTDEYPPFRLRP